MTDYEDIKGDKIESAIQSNITAVLETITDPRGRTNSSNFIYQADPRSKSMDFDGYPMIYIEDYGEQDERSRNVKGNLLNSKVEVEFVIVAKDDSAQQKQWHDQITEELKFAFRYGKDTKLQENGLGDAELLKNNRETGTDREDEPVIRREIRFRMPTQIDLDAV